MLNKTQTQTISKAPTQGKWKRTNPKLQIRSQALKFCHWTHCSSAFPSQLTSLKTSEFCLRSQTRFLPNKRTKDAQCFGQLPDHRSHYWVLPNSAAHSLETQGRNLLKKRKVRKERKEEMKFFPVTCNSALWMVGGKAGSQQTLPQGQWELAHKGRRGTHKQLSPMLRWNSSALGREKVIPLESIKAGKEILCPSDHQEPLLLLVQRSHALSFPTLGKIIRSPFPSWAILRFLAPEAASGSSFLKLKEHWECLWTFKFFFSSNSSESSLQLCLLKVFPEMQENRACSGNC